MCVCVCLESTEGQTRFPAAHSTSLRCNLQRARHLVSCTSPVQSAGSGCQMSDGSSPKCYLLKGIGPDTICGVSDPEFTPKALAVAATRPIKSMCNFTLGVRRRNMKLRSSGKDEKDLKYFFMLHVMPFLSYLFINSNPSGDSIHPWFLLPGPRLAD